MGPAEGNIIRAGGASRLSGSSLRWVGEVALVQFPPMP
jgi:hypothetical protein